MSSNEPLPQPDESIQPARDEVAPALPAAAAPTWPAEVSDVPPRRFFRPFPLHPSFWWALLWCFALLLFSQVPASVIAVLLLVGIILANPRAVGDPKNPFSSPAIQVVVGVSLVLAHLTIILLALLMLRVVAGRDWARQVALRRPAFSHVLLTVALVPGLLILGNGLYAVLKELGFPGLGDLPGFVAFLTAVLAALAVIGLGHLLVRVALGAGWYRERFEPGTPGVKAALSAGLIGLFLGVAALTYLLLKPRLSGVLPSASGGGLEEMVKMFGAWPAVLAVGVIAALPALSEELWCRAFLGRGLVGLHGYFWGVLLTSFLFGFIHLDPGQGTYALFIGLVLHAVYLCSRSLLIPMLLHFLNNGLTVILIRIPQLEKLESSAPEGGAPPWHLFAAAALLVAAVLAAMYQSRARLVAPEGEPAWQPDHPGVALPPTESSTRVWSPWPALELSAGVVAALALFGLSLVAALAGY